MSEWTPTLRDMLTTPLPPLSATDRALVRGTGLLMHGKIAGVSGLAHVLPDRDPFILVANHSTRIEAVLLPLVLMLLRNGKHVHFLSDWNFQLIPGVAQVLRAGQVITVPNKPAKPRFLNALKPLIVTGVPPLTEVRRKLDAGRSVGIFPEGTINRDPLRLLRGRRGAALLSLDAGVPIVPAGLRFPDIARGASIPDGARLEIEFGPALNPSPGDIDVAAWHSRIMGALAALSGKLPPFHTGAHHEDLRDHAEQTS